MTEHTPRGTEGDGPTDKARLAETLDLRAAQWRRVQPRGETVEYAFVPHSDGVTYVALRHSARPEQPVLVFTPSEWDAFLAGVRDGEFDRPATG